MKHPLLAFLDEEQATKAAELTANQAVIMKNPALKRTLPSFEIGDTVDVHQWIELGEKGRTQIFNGVVIARDGGGVNQTFTVRRIVQGEGVERIFLLHSPKILKIEVKRSGKVRRAKLYYLRDRVGKATRLKERKVKVPEGYTASGVNEPKKS